MTDEKYTLHVETQAPETDCVPSYCVVLEGPTPAAIGSGETPWEALRQAADRWEEWSGVDDDE